MFALYRSADGGQTWSREGQDLEPRLRIDAIGEIGAVRLAGTERGLFVSRDDGHSWTRPSHGVPEDVKVFAFASVVDRADGTERVYAATARGVFIAGLDADDWRVARGLEQARVLSIVAHAGDVFAGTDGDGVHMLHAARAGIDRTDARDATRFVPIGVALPAGAQVFALEALGDSLFAGLYARGVYRLDRRVGEGRWTSAGDEWPLRLASTSGTLFSGRNPGGVFVSHDGGARWTDASRGLPSRAPIWMMGEARGSVFVGTTGAVGLFRSDDEGASWLASDRGLPPGADAITFGAGKRSLLVVVIRAASDVSP